MDLRIALSQPYEERWMKCEFLLLGKAVPDAIGNHSGGFGGIGLMQLDRCVERLLKQQVADVSDENRATGDQRAVEDSIEDVQQVADARKVLNHRGQDYRVVSIQVQ